MTIKKQRESEREREEDEEQKCLLIVRFFAEVLTILLHKQLYFTIIL